MISHSHKPLSWLFTWIKGIWTQGLHAYVANDLSTESSPSSYNLIFKRWYLIYCFVLISSTNVNWWKLSQIIRCSLKTSFQLVSTLQMHHSWAIPFLYIQAVSYPFLKQYWSEHPYIYTFHHHFSSVPQFGVLYTRSPGQDGGFFCPRLLKHTGKLFCRRQHHFFCSHHQSASTCHMILLSTFWLWCLEKKMFYPISQVMWTDRP